MVQASEPAEVSEGAPSSEPPSSGGLVAVGTSMLRPGSVLAGRWRIESVVGEGGTATVYRGHDTSSERAVAVKVLRPALGREPSMRERFRREVRAVSLVQHPAAVSVLGDGSLDDGTPFLVMELLDGETLDARLARKGQRLPATEVLWAIDRVLDVLAAAHAKGLVHRDLKPDNIFLTGDRQIKVLDFGLARLKESASPLTRIGVVMGTPSFMPPEQARGQWDQVDVQTDLWAVGATMFFLLSGRLVHEGHEVSEVVEAATRQEAPSLRAFAPHLPGSIIEVVDLALAFDPQRRWRDARTMQLGLRRAYRHLHDGERDGGDEDDPIEEPSLDEGGSPEPPPMSIRFDSALTRPGGPRRHDPRGETLVTADARTEEAEDLAPMTSSDQDCPTLAPARPRLGHVRTLAVFGALVVAALTVFLATR